MSVLNIDYYDSDNDNDEFGGGINEHFDNTKEKTPDELTDELREILEKRLSDILTITVIGYKSFRLDFFESGFDLIDKDCNCEFDIDSDKIPIMPNGGQEYIVPYLYDLKDFYEELKNCKFQTNLNKKFTIKNKS